MQCIRNKLVSVGLYSWLYGKLILIIKVHANKLTDTLMTSIVPQITNLVTRYLSTLLNDSNMLFCYLPFWNTRFEISVLSAVTVETSGHALWVARAVSLIRPPWWLSTVLSCSSSISSVHLDAFHVLRCSYIQSDFINLSFNFIVFAFSSFITLFFYFPLIFVFLSLITSLLHLLTFCSSFSSIPAISSFCVFCHWPFISILTSVFIIMASFPLAPPPFHSFALGPERLGAEEFITMYPTT